jgi:putative oxidoreductase
MLTAIDAISRRLESLLVLLGRLALAALFIPSGFNKLTGIAGFAQMLAGRGVPAPTLMAWIGAIVELIAGIALALGLKTRAAALALIAFTVIATLIAHRFWDYPEAQRAMQQIQFMKNLAVIGGLLLLVARGGGRWSVDRER